MSYAERLPKGAPPWIGNVNASGCGGFGGHIQTACRVSQVIWSEIVAFRNGSTPRPGK